jgi:hypothetical protein
LNRSSRRSSAHHVHSLHPDVESLVSSHLSKEELALGASPVGERLPYNDYTTIDWLHDLVCFRLGHDRVAADGDQGQGLFPSSSYRFSRGLRRPSTGSMEWLSRLDCCGHDWHLHRRSCISCRCCRGHSRRLQEWLLHLKHFSQS